MLIHDVHAFTEQWHDLRRNRIGASEISGLFGHESPTYGLSRWALYWAKGHGQPIPDVSDERSEAGTFLEHGILQYAQFKLGNCEVERHVYAIDDQLPEHMGASLDGLIAAPTPEILEVLPLAHGPGVLDAKNVNWLTYRDEWPENPNNPAERWPPIRYQLQVQDQLACAGLAWGGLAVMVGGDHLELTLYYRSEPAITAIREAVRSLYADIAAGREPPIDALPITSTMIRAQTRRVLGQTLNAETDARWDAVCEAREQAAQARRAVEREYARADNALRQQLGEYVRAITPSYVVTGEPDKNGTRRYTVKPRRY